MKKIICLICVACFLGNYPALAELNSTEYIDIVKNKIPLSSRLNNEYSGYSYVVSSRYPHSLNVTGGQIPDGVNGQTAYLNVEKGSAAVIWSTLGTGFILGFVSFGITFLCALVATPVIWIVNSSQNKKAKRESTSFSNQIPLGIVNQGDSIKFTTLIPIGQQPQVKLIFQDMKTKEIFTLSR